MHLQRAQAESGVAERAGVPSSRRDEPGSRSVPAVPGRSSSGAAGWVWWGVAGAALLAAAVATFGLGRNPLSHDEVFTAVVSTRPMSLLLTILAKREGNMPLYYLLMHGWVQGGTDVAWLRLPSALAAAAAVPVTALVARRAFNDRVAVAAALLLALNAFSLTYARQARTYAFTMLLVAATTLLLLRAVESRSRRSWSAYGLLSLVAIGAQPLVAGLMLIAQSLSLALVPRDRLQLRLAGTVLGALFAVFGSLALYISRVQSATTNYITPTEFEQLVHFVDRLAGGTRLLALVFTGLGAIALLLLARQRVRRSMEHWRRWLIVSWAVVPPVVLVLMSEVRPVWRDRYLVAVTPAVVILVAFAIDRLRPRAVAAGALAVVLALSTVQVVARLGYPARLDLPGAAAFVVEESRPSDAIVYSGAAGRTPFLWELQQAAADRRLPRDIALAPGGGADEVRDLFAREVDAPVLQRRLASCERIWVVSFPRARWHPTPEPMQTVEASPFWQQFEQVAQREFGDVRIQLFENDLPGGTGVDAAGCPLAEVGAR